MNWPVLALSIVVAIVFTAVCSYIGFLLWKWRNNRASRENERILRSHWIGIGHYAELVLEGKVERVHDNLAAGYGVLDLSFYSDEDFASFCEKFLAGEKKPRRFGIRFILDLYEPGLPVGGPWKKSRNPESESIVDKQGKLARADILTAVFPYFDKHGQNADFFKVLTNEELDKYFSDLKGFRRNLGLA